MLKGILTIALKHPLYGRFAYNLALSVKAKDPKERICVIADDVALSHLHEGQKMIFDKIIKPKPSQCTRDGKLLPLITKFYLHKLTPYKEATLFVDADMIFSPEVDFNKLWAEHAGISWTMANRGTNDPDKGISEWVDSGKLKEAYGDLSQWYDLSSEWIYFENTELADSIFTKAKAYYDEGKLLTRSFAGDKPDEPFFNLALAELNHAPHKAPWQPTYWQPAIRKVYSAHDIRHGYYAFSAGGNHLPSFQKKVYDEFLKIAAFKNNMQGMQIYNKRNQIKERNLI